MKFKSELNKFLFQRFMQRLGLRIDAATHGAFSYDARNYPAAVRAPQTVIFDVGANIGQSAIWYSKNFPRAAIFSFEPFSVIYKELVRNTRTDKRIGCYQMALTDKDGETLVPTVRDSRCQSGKILPGSSSEICERILTRTVDTFAEEHGIDHVHILKTDTEGFDLKVLSGATRMLQEKKISYVLAEVSLCENDSDHTNFSMLKTVLEANSFVFHAFYDLHYSIDDGKLEYCNALFRFEDRQP